MDFTKKYNEQINKLDKLKVNQVKLSKELQLSYEYKEDIITKMQFADNQIKHKQQQYHKLLGDIQTEISKLKIEFDLHVAELNVC